MGHMLDKPHLDAEAGGGDDTVLPAQFWTLPPDPRIEPEKRLMVAVLEEAIAVTLSARRNNVGGHRSAAAEAGRWMESDDRSTPFAFASICDVLGLDIGRVRETVASWRERQRGFRRPRLQSGRGRHQVRTAARRPRRAA